MNEIENCPYCRATIIGSAVSHTPDCPTWEEVKTDE